MRRRVNFLISFYVSVYSVEDLSRDARARALKFKHKNFGNHTVQASGILGPVKLIHSILLLHNLYFSYLYNYSIKIMPVRYSLPRNNRVC